MLSSSTTVCEEQPETARHGDQPACPKRWWSKEILPLWRGLRGNRAPCCDGPVWTSETEDSGKGRRISRASRPAANTATVFAYSSPPKTSTDSAAKAIAIAIMMITATMACRTVKRPSPITDEAATVRLSAHDATRLEAAGRRRVASTGEYRQEPRAATRAQKGTPQEAALAALQRFPRSRRCGDARLTVGDSVTQLTTKLQVLSVLV